MSVFYCVTDRSLRAQIEDEGIVAGHDAGFYLLPEEPDLEDESFDVWSIVLADVEDNGLPQIVRNSISPLVLCRVEPSRSYAMAV